MFKVRIKGSDRVLAEYRGRRANLAAKLDEFLKRLAEVVYEVADDRYTEAFIAYQLKGDKTDIYYEPDITVSIEPIKNGYRVVAAGEEVLFVEFGAGVHYNGSDAYPGTRPEGVVGIGEYGRGLGKNQMWFFSKDGEHRVSYGNPPFPAMYYANEELQRQIERIAKEVFR